MMKWVLGPWPQHMLKRVSDSVMIPILKFKLLRDLNFIMVLREEILDFLILDFTQFLI